MPYAPLLLAESDIFGYRHFDGFTERLLTADLVVDAAGYFCADLRYRAWHRGQSAKHSYGVERELLPANLFHQLTALLAGSGFAELPAGYASHWDDLGSAQLVGRTAAGVRQVEIEEPYGRKLSKTAPSATPTSTEAALLAVRDACFEFIQQLYARATTPPHP